jgi:hypothetical protein
LQGENRSQAQAMARIFNAARRFLRIKVRRLD